MNIALIILHPSSPMTFEVIFTRVSAGPALPSLARGGARRVITRLLCGQTLALHGASPASGPGSSETSLE